MIIAISIPIIFKYLKIISFLIGSLFPNATTISYNILVMENENAESQKCRTPIKILENK